MISKSNSLLADQPDEIILCFQHELDDLIGLTAFPEFNLNAQNYEWVIGKAFEILKENIDQEYLQCEFTIAAVSTIMPHIRLFGGGENSFNLITQTLLRTADNLHKRLMFEHLFFNDRFPYAPVQFVSQRDIIFQRKSDGLPFILKNKI